ncbi:hypothetical protein COCOBI_19-2010 [Coccomyxa sp. Obi]|nr:hypothetical protein COCOBI_19-2010 [Coccomyxa sp. Obi]
MASLVQYFLGLSEADDGKAFPMQGNLGQRKACSSTPSRFCTAARWVCLLLQLLELPELLLQFVALQLLPGLLGLLGLLLELLCEAT